MLCLLILMRSFQGDQILFLNLWFRGCVCELFTRLWMLLNQIHINALLLGLPLISYFILYPKKKRRRKRKNSCANDSSLAGRKDAGSLLAGSPVSCLIGMTWDARALLTHKDPHVICIILTARRWCHFRSAVVQKSVLMSQFVGCILGTEQKCEFFYY